MPAIDRQAIEEVAATPPVFVIGCPRSGTTLFQVMLDTHGDLTLGHECEFITDVAFDPEAPGWTVAESVERAISSDVFHRLGVDAATCRAIVDELRPTDFGQVVRYWFAARALQDGKHRWGNKAPYMIFHVERAAALFPDAKFIHIIRDGRQSAVSWASVLYDTPTPTRPQVLSTALMWRRMSRAGRRGGIALGRNRYTEIHLEDLIADTEGSLRRICAFMGVDFDPAMLRYHETAAERVPEERRSVHPAVSRPPTRGLRDWTADLPAGDIVAIEGILRRSLVEFGYEPGPRPERRTYELAHVGRGWALGGMTGLWAYRTSLTRELRRRAQALDPRRGRPAGASSTGSAPR